MVTSPCYTEVVEVRIGKPAGPGTPPWLKDAKDLVEVAPPTDPKDAFSLTRVYQPDENGRSSHLVGCLAT